MVPQLKILARFEAETQLQIYLEELNSIQMKTIAILFKSFPDSRHTEEHKIAVNVVIFSIISGDN